MAGCGERPTSSATRERLFLKTIWKEIPSWLDSERSRSISQPFCPGEGETQQSLETPNWQTIHQFSSLSFMYGPRRSWRRLPPTEEVASSLVAFVAATNAMDEHVVHTEYRPQIPSYQFKTNDALNEYYLQCHSLRSIPTLRGCRVSFPCLDEVTSPSNAWVNC